jgi:hypothetical protein
MSGWRLWLGSHWRPGIFLRTPWGHLSIKLKRDRLFSERNGYTPTRTIGPICFSWRVHSGEPETSGTLTAEAM